jgi:hypothetical protein
MARKKATEKAEEAPAEYTIDVSKLALTKEKYVDLLEQYLQEQLKATFDKDGNTIMVKVPKGTEKRTVRFRINKFLYTSGLKNTYKIISWVGGKGNGYQILEK